MRWYRKWSLFGAGIWVPTSLWKRLPCLDINFKDWHFLIRYTFESQLDTDPTDSPYHMMHHPMPYPWPKPEPWAHKAWACNRRSGPTHARPQHENPCSNGHYSDPSISINGVLLRHRSNTNFFLTSWEGWCHSLRYSSLCLGNGWTSFNSCRYLCVYPGRLVRFLC